jgi:hypothetical protein
LRWNHSLIYVSVFSYLTIIITTLMGIPPLARMSSTDQLVLYSLSAIGLTLSSKIQWLKPILAANYGVVAMLSFSGYQIWIDYVGDLNLGPYISLWDISLALALMSDYEFPKIELNQ